MNSQALNVCPPLPKCFYLGLVSTCSSAEKIGEELKGTGYARVPLERGEENWGFALGTGNKPPVSFNKHCIRFPKAKADWGAYTGIIIMDAPTGGNCLFYENFDVYSVKEGDVVTFLPQCLRIFYDL